MLISEEYRSLNRRMHETKPHYGTSGSKYAPNVLKLCEQLQTKDILDYGCGKRTLAKSMDFPIREYDPAVEGLDTSPEPADIVVCTDVLEHIEPEFLDSVLDELMRLTKRSGFFTVATREANKHLEDGRNAHLIVKTLGWWITEIEKRFFVSRIQNIDNQMFMMIVVKK